MFPIRQTKLYDYESCEIFKEDLDDKVKLLKPSKDSRLLATYLNQVVIDLFKVDSKLVMMPTGYTVQKTKTLRLFCKKGTRCVSCGLRGEIFKEWREKGKTYSFLCLYGIKHTSKGTRHILMTADHIFPKSLGGHNGYYNLQPMCSDCNNKKGNRLPESIVINLKTMEQKNVLLSHRDLLSRFWRKIKNG